MQLVESNIWRRTESSFGLKSHWHTDLQLNLCHLSQWQSVSIGRQIDGDLITDPSLPFMLLQLFKCWPRESPGRRALARDDPPLYWCPFSSSSLPLYNFSPKRRKSDWWWDSQLWKVVWKVSVPVNLKLTNISKNGHVMFWTETLNSFHCHRDQQQIFTT